MAIRNDPCFQGFLFFLIFLTALQIGMETDKMEMPMSGVMNTTVVVVFTFEVVIKFIADEFNAAVYLGDPVGVGGVGGA